MKKTYLFIIVGIVLAGIIFVGGVFTILGAISVRPGYIADDKAMTEQAIKQFHDRLSAGQYESIYQDADVSLKQSFTQEHTIASMKDVRDRFGSVKTVTFSKLNVIVGAPVQIRAVYNTTYEKGKVTEAFTFIKQGDTVRLAHYQVFPGTVKP